MINASNKKVRKYISLFQDFEEFDEIRNLVMSENYSRKKCRYSKAQKNTLEVKSYLKRSF